MHGGVDGELFETLSASTREALLRAGRPREFRPGEVVFHQGDPCDSLFLLRRGRVSVKVLTPDGDERCRWVSHSDTLDWLTLSILRLGCEFYVHGPPELVEHLHAITHRLGRSLQMT